MKKKSGSTNKILIGFIFFLLLIIVFFLGKGNYAANLTNLFTTKESLLRQRYNEFVLLQNNKKYEAAYNYFSSSSKNQLSLGNFKKGFDSGNIEKQKVSINKIIIKDDLAYIDRNDTICKDINCNSKEELRGYKQWVFENGNWFSSLSSPLCIRETPYDMPPEFQRALSLIKQRFGDYFKDIDLSFINCVDVEYGNVGDSEGLFTFEENNSNIDKLMIRVDKSYANSDDLLTAFLLAHETTHASLYLYNVEQGIETLCVDNETQAFTNQLIFSGLINQEERNSLQARLNAGYQNINNQLKIEWDLFTLGNQAERICGVNQFNSCVLTESKKLIENWVRSNPYYQKECNL